MLDSVCEKPTVPLCGYRIQILVATSRISDVENVLIPLYEFVVLSHIVFGSRVVDLPPNLPVLLPPIVHKYFTAAIFACCFRIRWTMVTAGRPPSLESTPSTWYWYAIVSVSAVVFVSVDMSTVQ